MVHQCPYRNRGKLDKRGNSRRTGVDEHLADDYSRQIPKTPIFILRFPDGDVEYRSTRGELPIGTVIRARGALWRIRAYDGGAAMLETHEPAEGAVGGSVKLPDPFDDKPLTLEVLATA
jgi:hypothetical protein